MRRASRRLIASAVIATLYASHAGAQTIPAFPGAEGFGAPATGGRGGDVYHITKLNDDGSVGTLRHGIENAPAAGRTIVFDLGGWITLNDKLGLTRSRVTIAGHTAPGGIGIRNGQFSVGGDDVIVRHMRFRPGKITNTDHDSVNTNENAQRVIYDHISAEFSTDGGFDLQADDVTLQNSSVSFGLLTHSTGGLIQSPTGGAAGQLSFHHNLFAHNETRNPKARAELIDWRDNVIYNYHNGFLAGESESDVNPNWRANFDGNTYISNVGGNASSGGRPMMTGGRTQNYDLWFGVNALDRDSDSTHDPIVYDRAAAMSNQQVVSSAYNWSTMPFDVGTASVWQSGSAAAAYTRVLEQFGATPWARDAVNQLIHDQVISRTGQRISNENTLGIANAGYPTLGGVPAPTDTDTDGMPDAWEIKHGTLPTVANNNADFDSDGYTDLEEYLNDLAAFPAPGPIVFDGSGRYADWANWTARWSPTRMDEVHINTGTATVDARGQRAGILHIGATTAGGVAPVLNVQSGWIEVTNELRVGATGAGRVIQTGGTLYAGALSVDTANGSTVDMNSAMIVGGGTSRSAIEAYVVSGRNGGAWDGAGITSSQARSQPNGATGIGVLSGAEYTTLTGASTFAGRPITPGDTLLKYTWNGDTNFSGDVNFDDYVRIDVGFNSQLSGWVNGDFNYSGSVNFDDYVLIDVAFNTQSGTLGRAIAYLDGTDRSASGRDGAAVREVVEHVNQFGAPYARAFLAAVPEPSGAAVVLAGPFIMSRRRRRKSETY